jgi:hypothetical protein
MEKSGPGFEDLPFELTQLSKPARKYLKVLAAGLVHYQKDLPAREAELFSLKNDSKEYFHD